MKKMKNLLIILTILMIGCSSEAQRNNSNSSTESKESKVLIEGGILISFEGIDVSKYELNVEDFEVEEITKDHLLCLATDECDETLIRELIEKGADVNFKCEEVDDVITNLAFCKENGVKLTELLLSKGANINGADEDNDSFLSYAISNDNLELVDYLIANGANPTQRDTNRNMGCLPIHGCENLEMLKKLEIAGFEINVTCDNGRNLLHFAARENFKDIAQYLVVNKLVNIDQKDKNGETPLDYANRANNSEIVKIITIKK
jgi:ankyrin repeat protein